jgi:hypothetical protein
MMPAQGRNGSGRRVVVAAGCMAFIINRVSLIHLSIDQLFSPNDDTTRILRGYDASSSM